MKHNSKISSERGNKWVYPEFPEEFAIFLHGTVHIGGVKPHLFSYIARNLLKGTVSSHTSPNTSDDELCTRVNACIFAAK